MDTPFAAAIQELSFKAGGKGELARSSGIHQSLINRLLYGEVSLTLKMATRLELVSERPAKDWMHMFVDHLFDSSTAQGRLP